MSRERSLVNNDENIKKKMNEIIKYTSNLNLYLYFRM